MSDAETVALALLAGVMLGCALFIVYSIGLIQGRRERNQELERTAER